MFDTYEVAKQLIVRLRPMVATLLPVDADLADQMRRAASSVLLNLAEGQRFTNGNKLRHHELAHGSAHEVKGALDAAVAWGFIEQADAELALLDRLLALLWKLTSSPKLLAQSRRPARRARPS